MDKLIKAVFLTVIIQLADCSDKNICVQKSQCLCEFSEYSKIDISTVTPKTPQSFLQDDISTIRYHFHGCSDGEYKYYNTKKNLTEIWKTSLVRQDVSNETNTKNLGNSAQIVFNPTASGDYEIIYRNGTNVTASIRLNCDNYEKPFIKVIDSTLNMLVLSSPACCIITHHQGLSTGSVLVILLFSSMIIYFIGGAVILYFVRGARGLELVPNIDFWRSLPGLVKDGIIFIFNGCNPHVITTTETYDRI